MQADLKTMIDACARRGACGVVVLSLLLGGCHARLGRERAAAGMGGSNDPEQYKVQVLAFDPAPEVAGAQSLPEPAADIQPVFEPAADIQPVSEPAANIQPVSEPAANIQPVSVSDGVRAHANYAELRPGLVVNVSVVVGGKKVIEEVGRRISESNTLSLPLLETIAVEKMTLERLSERLTQGYREFYVNPQVMVEFVRDDNREGISPWGYVTVLGRVKRPGQVSIPPTRDMTLSGAIQQAGGLDTSAKDTAIRITRRTVSGQTETVEINLRSVGARGRVDHDIVLLPEDVVFVPELVF
jgi:protein involved in polysaccharide export with SLBB domain